MTWEYKVFDVDRFLNEDENLTIEEELNKYGKQGWELIGILEKNTNTLGNAPKLATDSIVFKKTSAK